ncbi:MAG: HEPN domain-containing protein [Lachnospiraceae bacterium]|nr:HEPN domain-containing protein [Lachnospiraceae bacterium]
MDSRIKDLSKYRFQTSLESLTDAKIMYDNGRYKNALNRAYYSIFHAIRAVCALDGFDSSKHSGVISYFNQNYVKTEAFSRELSKIIRYASENREKADYLDFFVASRDEAEKQIERAEYFSKEIRQYLIQKGVITDEEAI